MIDTKAMANNIYSACCGFDASDYAETQETDLKNLESALDKIDSYADWNEDFKALAEALRVLFED